MRVQREPPSVVRSRSRFRSFSFSFVRSRSRCASSCGAASARTRKVQNRWLWSCARGGCGLCLLGARLSPGISPSQYPRLPCTLQRLGFSTIQQLNWRGGVVTFMSVVAPLRKFCSPEDSSFHSSTSVQSEKNSPDGSCFCCARKKEFSMPSMLGKRIVRIVKEELEAGRQLECPLGFSLGEQ